MSVTTADLKDGAPVKGRASVSGAPLAGALMLAFGLPFWWLGAKYSLDGWALGLNTLFEALTLPVQLPRPAGWWVLLALPLGVAYSYVEVKVRPRKGVRIVAGAALLLLMFLTHITDVGSTYIAIVTPAGPAWPIHQWAAREAWPAGLWALFLTYAPEVLILGGVRSFK